MWYETPTYFRAQSSLTNLNRYPTYVGIGEDAGYYAYFDGSSGGYIIAAGFTPNIKIGNRVFFPVYSLINGHIYWQSPEAKEYIYYHNGRYILISEVLETPIFNDERYYPGLSPYSIRNPNTDLYEGEGWYYTMVTLDGITPGFLLDISIIFYPAGACENQPSPPPIEATAELDYYVCMDEGRTGAVGKYDRVGASGEKYIGTPWWSDNLGNEYEPALSPGQRFDNAIRYLGTDGDIVYGYSRGWIIGDYGSPAGWYTGNRPNRNGSVTFEYMYPEGIVPCGSTETPPSRTLTFRGYREGNIQSSIYIAEPNICR